MHTLTVLSYIFASLAFLSGCCLFLKLQMPHGFPFIVLKLGAGATAPLAVAAGVLGLLLGILAGAWPATILGGAGAAASIRYIVRILHVKADFDKAFGRDWRDKIKPQLTARLPHMRWIGWLKAGPEPRWEKDIPFCQIPGSQRQLLCDIWQPPAGLSHSGLVFIYFHGSDWYLLDKDFGTRPLFHHLAQQGHVVMDVAYRLAPEADMAGMLGDIKRAIAWIKDNAAHYGVDPQRVVIGGGSAGAHLSMLAAFDPQHAVLTPQDLGGRDLSVRGVISHYGPSDLTACYFHTHQDKTTREVQPITQAETLSPSAAEPGAPGSAPSKRTMAQLGFTKSALTGTFVRLLGGHPEQAPEPYALYSPIHYVHSGCPATLLLQGEDDMMTPVQAMRILYEKLCTAGVPALMAVYPQTDHAYDLILPSLSPPAQAALYEIDHFLAVLA